MPSTTVEGDADFQAKNEPVPGRPAYERYEDPLDALSPAGYLGSRSEIEAELNLIAASIRTFHRIQPDQVLKYCSGYTARLSEMQVLLHRIESTDRQYTRIRTMQVEKFIVELDRQWKTASRLIEVMRQDLILSGHGGA